MLATQLGCLRGKVHRRPLDSRALQPCAFVICIPSECILCEKAEGEGEAAKRGTG